MLEEAVKVTAAWAVMGKPISASRQASITQPIILFLPIRVYNSGNDGLMSVVSNTEFLLDTVYIFLLVYYSILQYDQYSDTKPNVACWSWTEA